MSGAQPAGPRAAEGSALFALLNVLRPGEGRPGHGLSGREVLALVVVVDRAGTADGVCTAALATLAETAGVSRNTMQRSVADLVAAGWLSRDRQGRDLPDVLRVGPVLLKRYHGGMPETSQVGTSSAQEVPKQGSKRYHGGTQSTPLSTPVGGGAPVVSITAVRGARRPRGGGVEVDPALEPAVEAWLRIFPASGRTGGLVQAIERAVAQGYTVAQVVQALDVVVDAKANPAKYRPKETPRFLAEDRRGRVPGFVLVPSRIDELLACVPEPAKPRPVYRWKEA